MTKGNFVTSKQMRKKTPRTCTILIYRRMLRLFKTYLIILILNSTYVFMYAQANNAWIINFIFKHRASHLSKYRTIYQIKYIPYTSTLMVKICLIMKLGYRWYIPLLQNITWNWAWELNNITCLLFYFTRFYNPKQISWRPNFSAILREITKVNSFYMVGITLHRELNNITYLLFYFTRYLFVWILKCAIWKGMMKKVITPCSDSFLSYFNMKIWNL